jgi:hypothetical protein
MWMTNLLKVLRATRGGLERIYGSVCEPKMAAYAEMRPGPPISANEPRFRSDQKSTSSPVEQQEGQADRHCDVQTEQITRQSLDPDRPDPAQARFLGPVQDSESPPRSLYRLGCRYSNLAPDSSPLRHTHPCIVYRVSELRHPKLV